MIVYEIILAGFKFGDFPQNCKSVKLKTSPKFPGIWYSIFELHSYTSDDVLLKIRDYSSSLETPNFLKNYGNN